MGRGRSAHVRFGSAPGRGRGLLLAAKPALQGTFAGQGGVGMAVGQAYSDIACPPSRMLLPQGQSGSIEGVVVGGSAGTWPVGRGETLGLVAEAAEQTPDGAWAELQGLGDGGSGLAPAGPTLDKAAQRQGERDRHGSPRTSGSGMVPSYSPAASRPNL